MAVPTLADCKTYMGVTSWTDPVITAALAAETAAQRARCQTPTPFPDDLREALLRRVARNLAMRNLPLAMPSGDAEGGPQILPGRDPEVRRLEAPHRRLIIG